MRAKKAQIATSRAWIAPETAQLTSGIAKGIPLTLEKYSNTGKSPALDVRPIYILKQVEGQHFDDNSFNSLIEADDICKGVKIANGADVIYPEQPNGYKLLFGVRDPGWLTDDVVSGKTAIVMEMCFAYKTTEEIHHMSFCYFYRAGVSLPSKQMNICTAGNHAD